MLVHCISSSKKIIVLTMDQRHELVTRSRQLNAVTVKASNVTSIFICYHKGIRLDSSVKGSEVIPSLVFDAKANLHRSLPLNSLATNLLLTKKGSCMTIYSRGLKC